MTDQTDDGRPSQDELEDRVEQLEQAVSEMLPSRRDALKLGGTALAAGGLGSALTGSASAGSASVGTVGTSSDPVDIEAEDITLQSSGGLDASGSDINNVGSLDTGDANINGQTALRASNISVGTSSFGSWTQVNSSRPGIVFASAQVETDGSTEGDAKLEVDDSGTSGPADRFVTLARVDAGSTVLVQSSASQWVPGGGQYQVRNEADPNGNNAVGNVIEITL